MPAPCTATALLVVCRRRRPSECHANYKVGIGGRFCPHNRFPRQRPLRDRKNNFSLFIHIPANFVKIGHVDGVKIGLTKIAKNIFKRQNFSPPRQRFAQSGRAEWDENKCCNETRRWRIAGSVLASWDSSILDTGPAEMPSTRRSSGVSLHTTTR